MEGTFLQYVVRLAAAMVAGGLIGIEREIKGKPAGMRTNILMCTGSCLLMVLSLEIFRSYKTGMGDPSRLAAGVVMGIGFLGAGAIIQSRHSVAGLTSAATLWLVAAIGLVIGWGNYMLAGAATVLSILTLTLLGGLERFVSVKRRRHLVQFHLVARGPAMALVKDVLHNYKITAENIHFELADDTVVVKLDYTASNKQHARFLKTMRGIDEVEILIEY